MEKGTQSNEIYERERIKTHPPTQILPLKLTRKNQRKTHQFTGNPGKSKGNWPNSCQFPLNFLSFVGLSSHFLGRTVLQKLGRSGGLSQWNALETVLFLPYFRVRRKLPNNTVKPALPALPSNKSYESKTGHNRTPAIVLWIPLKCAPKTAKTEETRRGPEMHGSESSMEDWDADLSPCNFATSHFRAERSSYLLQLRDRPFDSLHLKFYLP